MCVITSPTKLGSIQLPPNQGEGPRQLVAMATDPLEHLQQGAGAHHHRLSSCHENALPAREAGNGPHHHGDALPALKEKGKSQS